MKNQPELKIGSAEVNQNTLRDLYRVVSRRRWVVIVAFLAVFVAAVLSAIRQPNIYQASTSLIIQRENKPILGVMMETEQSRNMINNQVEIIRSRSVALAAARRLTQLPDAAALGTADLALTVDLVMFSINVVSSRTTDIVSIVAESNNPRTAAAIANAVADAYIDFNLTINRGELAEVRKFLELQLPVIERRLSSEEDVLRNFRQSNQVVLLSEESRALLDGVSSFETQLNSARIERETVQRRIEYLRGLLDTQKKDLLDNLSHSSSSAVVSGLRDDLNALQVQLATLLSQGFAAESPQVKDVAKKVEATKSRLKDELALMLQNESSAYDPLKKQSDLVTRILDLQVDLDAWASRERALGKVVDEYSGKLNRIPTKEVELARLTRQFELDENIYKMLMEKYEEARISEAGKLGNVKVLDRAEVPLLPVGPRRMINIIFGVLLGMSLGIGIALFLEYLDTSIKTTNEVEKILALPVLGSIPAIDLEDVSSHTVHGEGETNGVTAIAERLISHHLPRSPISEAYRMLRTNLQFLNPDHPVKSILVTSAGPSEGKTTTAANLAITMAQVGARTLLVDGDLRRPMVAGVFGIEGQPGLTELLIMDSDLKKVVRPSGIENLQIVPAGTLPPNPSELLGSQKMKSIIGLMKENCDLVIFDCPPVITVTDAAVLAAEADVVLLVVQSGRTDREMAKRAKVLLNNVKANIAGVVLNNISPELQAGYYYYYHYYHEDSGKRKSRRRRGDATTSG
ncbi:MAG TPA: polysaccharide biosynthesis tyrosine autokinase [Candidatus Edwardsbacteria bacterium]|nr:polysaccharide biosynthesis tyrosine autokinase [Candidatus Edwardsbacteria bacterium]